MKLKMEVNTDSQYIVWKNFPIFSPKLVLEYAEDIHVILDRNIVLNANLDDARL